MRATEAIHAALITAVSGFAFSAHAQTGTPAPTEAATVQPTQGGSIVGHVLALRDRAPLGGLTVTIRENDRTTTTAPDGSYVFQNVAPGTYTVVAATSAGIEFDNRVTVATGQVTGDISADPNTSAADEIVVLAQRTPVNIARLAQKQAPNLVNVQTYTEIRKLPDVSVAEAVRRVPGISLETDEGEGRYVNIRGLDADLNSTTFGGLRLPPTNNASPFGGYRAVTLDSIPAGLIGALTVTKSNLPSQDAEALGGTIEITPKTAPRGGEPFIQGNIGSGYEPLRQTGIVDLSVTAGGHFGGSDGFFSPGPFSIVLSGTFYEDRRNFDDAEPAVVNDPVGGDHPRPYTAISNLDERNYRLHRRRHGYGIDLGYEPDANNSWYIRAFEAGYSEYYYRPHLSITPDARAYAPAVPLAADGTGGTPAVPSSIVVLPDGRLQDTLTNASAFTNQLRDEWEKSRDRVFVAGGKNIIGKNTIDYRVGYTEGSYDKPYDYNSTFTLNPASTANGLITYDNSGPGHLPRYTITGAPYLDPKQYTLTGFSNSTAFNFDREISAAGNYERQATFFGAESGSFKFGLSARIRHKRTTAQPFSYANVPPANPITLADISNNVIHTYYDGLYQIGAYIPPHVLQAQFGSGAINSAPGQSNDVISSQQQFLNAHEDVYAGYGEYQASWGKFSFIAGVRVEYTKDRSNAFQATTTAGDTLGNNKLTTTAPVSARRNYTNAFPSAQFKYEIAQNLIARATYSSTIARPGFNQANVSQSVDLGSGTVTQGNPNLKPATSNSFDLSLEKYLSGAGIISVGLFYKDLSDYIVSRTVPISSLPGAPNFHGGRLQSITFDNASGAYARGVEVNFDHRFRELLGRLSGLGIAANFTYVDSRVQVRPGDYTRLPSTSEYTYNAAMFYEKGPINLRVAVYSASADLFAIAADKAGDQYNATRTSVDFGSSYALTKHLTTYFNAKNLTNTPHAFYIGTANRPNQREFYGQTYQAGIRFDY